MGQRPDEQELRRRAIEGVRHEVEAFGCAAAESKLIRREGLVAAVVPASHQRSVFNSVFYNEPTSLAAEIGMLEEAYAAQDVSAWTVWVPDRDRQTASLLEERGHVLDGAPRAMAMVLADLGPEPPPPVGLKARAVDPETAAELNDRAYGFGSDGFSAGFAGETAVRWHGAFAGATPVGCVGTIDAGDDYCVSGVATPPEHRGRGVASWLLWRALDEARRRGPLTASLRASRAGAPLYERLGFRNLGFVEMWELRR